MFLLGGIAVTNEELVILIKRRINVAENMLQLWEQVKRFVYSIARKYQAYAELEDLEQEGYISLYDAVNGYDPESGCAFLTYAGFWIKQHLLRYIQNNGIIRVPVHEQQRIADYKKTVHAFRSQLGRNPTEWELSRFLNMSVKQIREVEQAKTMQQIGSIDVPVMDQDGEQAATVGDLLPSEEDLEADVLDRIERQELQRTIWTLVDTLPEEQKSIIRMYYQKGMTRKQIGELIGFTGSRVHTLESNGLRELRKPRNARLLRPYFSESRAALAYHGCGVQSFNRTWLSSTERAALDLRGNNEM